LTSDPFALLGVPVTLDLDAARLETIYLRKSRDTHPDHREGDSRDDTDETETLLHAAALNQAFRDLSDPWRRAEALVEHHAPDAMERAKRLAPEFLAEALELAEEVSFARADDDALRARIEARIDESFARLRDAVDVGDFDAAAARIHESRYFRKAKLDLARAAEPTR
jgi:Fe-S protein assembly co-chaperone HscB